MFLEKRRGLPYLSAWGFWALRNLSDIWSLTLWPKMIQNVDAFVSKLCDMSGADVTQFWYNLRHRLRNYLLSCHNFDTLVSTQYTVPHRYGRGGNRWTHCIGLGEQSDLRQLLCSSRISLENSCPNQFNAKCARDFGAEALPDNFLWKRWSWEEF